MCLILIKILRNSFISCFKYITWQQKLENGVVYNYEKLNANIICWTAIHGIQGINFQPVYAHTIDVDRDISFKKPFSTIEIFWISVWIFLNEKNVTDMNWKKILQTFLKIECAKIFHFVASDFVLYTRVTHVRETCFSFWKPPYFSVRSVSYTSTDGIRSPVITVHFMNIHTWKATLVSVFST